MAFLSGFVTEGVCTLWVSSVASVRALRSGILSACWAGLMLVGLGEAFSGTLPAVSWVLGYGAGSYAAVRWFGRLRP